VPVQAGEGGIMTILKWTLGLVVGAVVLAAGFVAAVLVDAGRAYEDDDDWQGIT